MVFFAWKALGQSDLKVFVAYHGLMMMTMMMKKTTMINPRHRVFLFYPSGKALLLLVGCRFVAWYPSRVGLRGLQPNHAQLLEWASAVNFLIGRPDSTFDILRLRASSTSCADAHVLVSALGIKAVVGGTTPASMTPRCTTTMKRPSSTGQGDALGEWWREPEPNGPPRTDCSTWTC